MKTIKVSYSSACLEYGRPGHPESPERMRTARDGIRGLPGVEFLSPRPAREADILRAHSPALLKTIKSGRFLDPDTPSLPGIFRYALLSAGAALQAQEIARREKIPALSLMRPPGHHAGRESPGGFCYFNNLAVAVCHALQETVRVAILDLDAHHGNGTQDIFQGNDRVLFTSLHQSPLYPGTGLKSSGNCRNYPLPPGTGEAAYLAALQGALAGIAVFKPDLLAVSLGFDTLAEDPLTDLRLETTACERAGALVGGLRTPTFAVLEGGYSAAIGAGLRAWITGFTGRKEFVRRAPPRMNPGRPAAPSEG